MINNQEIIEAYHFRHACKIFDNNKKIDEKDFNTILEVARLSPSSFGFEPWKFLVVQNMQLREELKKDTWGAQNTLPTASHFIVVLAKKQNSIRYDSKYIYHMMRDIHHLDEDIIKIRAGFYKNFQLNDFKLLESDRATFDWASKQTYIAVADMMSTAAMLGIDSCPIEGFNREKIDNILSNKFDIDTKEWGVSLMVAFGYRKDAQKPKTRQSLDDIVEWYN
jgi:nitroreductase